METLPLGRWYNARQLESRLGRPTGTWRSMSEIHQSTASQPQIRAVLFADLGGSTRLYDELGDVAAHRIAAECTALISREVQKHGGTVIKTIGDEVMSDFATADEAIEAAKSIR